jgi:sulfite dehydrogenase (cytochrome) subunit B
MNNLQRKVIFLTAVLALATAALAQKTSVQLPPDNSVSQLKSAPGDDAVRKNCNFCHSTDYIVRQPHLGAQQWDAEVKKMIAVYGAPISAADAQIIAEYLAKNYGIDDGFKRTDPPRP